MRLPSISFGHVQPLGERNTIIGHSGRFATAVALRVGFDALQIEDDAIERGRHELVHRVRIAAFDEVRLVAVATEQMIELFVADAREHAGVRDLVAIQMQDRQHHAIGQRIQELVGMPARGKRPGFRFAIADDAGDDQVRIVESCTERVRQRITSSPPSWIEPGVSGATWLGIPPGTRTA